MFVYFSITIIHASAPALNQLPLVDSLTRDGVTWRFASPVRAGKFVNGDWYVVGETVVRSISPAPANGRNGSVLNIPMNSGISGFDDRVVENRYRESLRVTLPVTLRPGDALISSISLNRIGDAKCWLRESDTPVSPVRSVSVLTCLSQPQSPRAFRPSYGDRGQRIYDAGNLRRHLLPSLKSPSTVANVRTFADHFSHTWLDVCFFSFDAAVGYQPAYGRETGRAVGMATLLLMLEGSSTEKEQLLIGFVQYGIDLWGLVRSGYHGWPAHGGHGSGRKWPIIFSGLLLGDSAMMRPSNSYPEIRFGEDMQTMYGESWTGAKVVYAGHMGVFKGQVVNSRAGWGPYEHLPPSQWHDNLGETYRRCCTSLSWIGQALSARLLGAKALWGHDAFFDYCDRWMTENDAAAVAEIRQARGWDFSASWSRQRQCWDAFVEQMWASYRSQPTRNQPERKTLSPQRSYPSMRMVMSGTGHGVRIMDSNGRMMTVQGQKIRARNSDL